MSLKIQFSCLILLLSINSIFAFKCKFSKDLFHFYTCEITQDSQNQQETHLPDKTDEDVKEVVADGIPQLESSEFPFCVRFKNIQRITILKANYVDENLLQNCLELNTIRINNGKLDKFPEKLFSKNSKLILVELSNNNLKELPENIFSNLNNLSALTISSNNLLHLPSKIFNPVQNLGILSLQNNGFKSLNPKWFENLQKLGILILNFNEILDLPKNVFKPLKNLNHLWLWANELTVIHSDSFGININIQNIDLKQNRINEIDQKLFDNVNVSSLDMEINNICYSAKITSKNDMKKKLKKCFGNYKPRKEANSMCGTHKIGRETILGGTQIEQGSYPLNVALVTNDGTYFCGGTLVSNKTIVTAANCFIDKSEHTIQKTSDIKVLLGGHNLDVPENNRISIPIKSINIHSEWNSQKASSDTDIAILELTNEVQFNDFIQPICLIESDVEKFENLTGKIIGYSQIDSGHIAKVYESSVINHQTCSTIKYLESHLSPRTFCGGYENGTGSCNGDIGSGLIVNKDGNFYLRGIVSASLRNIKNDCQIAEHLVLADVQKFISFIKSGGHDVFDDKVRLLKEENEKLKKQVKNLQEDLNKKNKSWLCRFA